MFDKVEIRVVAGDGGDGAVSFRHEKFVPLGGPDGGDGGNGGSVVVRADAAIDDLRAFRRNKAYRAANGESGGGQKKHGKQGAALVLLVPAGTVVSETIGGRAALADLKQPGQEVIVARGGRGGLGNTHFATSTNQTPRLAQKGEPGEEKIVVLEMRLIADVGIIGYPNTGKSTLLAAASAAKPKIASYPFTTLEPVLGVVEDSQQSLVLAEIPGLVDGAHLGKGLGHEFLRHIIRTRILIHLLDGMAESPLENMIKVNTELALFDASLAQKPQIVAVNKLDLPEVQARRNEIKRTFQDAGLAVWFISAADGQGVAALMAAVMKKLNQLTAEAKSATPPVEPVVLRPRPRGETVRVRRQGEVFVVTDQRMERLVERVDLTNAEVLRQLQGQLSRLGISQALEKQGIQPGDKVRCGRFEWQW